MAATFTQLKKGILSRCKGVSGIIIEEVEPFVVNLFVQPKSPQIEESVIEEDIQAALAHVGLAHVHYKINTVGSLPSIDQPIFKGKYKLANRLGAIREPEIKKALSQLVPNLYNIAILSESHPDFPERNQLIISVADQNGNASDLLIENTKLAMEAIRSLGTFFRVTPLSNTSSHTELDNIGYAMPLKGHAQTVEDLEERDQAEFSKRVNGLLNGSIEKVVNVDDYSGSKVFCAHMLTSNSKISSFLPIYDRLFIQAIPKPNPAHQGTGDVFFDFFGIKEDDFVAFCSAGKIIPVFKFGFRHFPPELIDKIINNPALYYISPRDLDYLSAKYLWNSNPYIKELSTNRELFSDMEKARIHLQRSNDQPIIGSILGKHLHNAISFSEDFEGYLWERGHNLLSAMGRSGDINTAFDILLSNSPWDQGQQQTVSIESSLAAMNIGMANAFSASLFDSTQLNGFVMDIVSQLWTPEISIYGDEKSRYVGNVIDSFELSYNDSIPANEYLDIFDSSETKRLRRILHSIIENPEGKIRLNEEVREKVQEYNQGIRKVRKRELASNDVEVLGNVSSALSTVGDGLQSEGIKTAASVIDKLKSPLAAIYDLIVEDTSLANVSDKLRGIVNAVPSESIRIYRIQSQMRSKSR